MTSTVPGEATAKDEAIADDPVRVLHVYGGNLYGGIETFLRTLARHPTRESAVMDFALCFEGRIARELRESGATLHILGAVRVRSPRSIFAARRVLAETLRAGRYEVVVCHSAWPYALFAPVVRAHGARLAFHMHDVPNARGWIDQWANRTRPDLVLCNSEFTAANGRWSFRKTSRVVIRCAVEFDQGTARAARAEVRAALGATPEAVVILQASRMQAWKGHRLLIDALGQLRANPRWVLLDCRRSSAPQRGCLRARDANEGRANWPRRPRPVPGPAHRRACAHGSCATSSASRISAPSPSGSRSSRPLQRLSPSSRRRSGRCRDHHRVVRSIGPPDAPSVAANLAELIDDEQRRAVLSQGGPLRARELCDPEERAVALSRELARLAERHRFY